MHTKLYLVKNMRSASGVIVSLWEMNTATRVQILDDTVCNLYSADIHRKVIKLAILDYVWADRAL